MMEKYLNLNDVKEIRARSLIYFGCGAIQKVADVARDMKARGVDRVIVVSSPSAYKKSGAWPTITAAFEAAGVEYVLFDKNRPNPEVEAIDEATGRFRVFPQESGALGFHFVGRRVQ